MTLQKILKVALKGLLVFFGVLALFIVYLKISEPKRIYTLNSELDITELPDDLKQTFFNTFDRYTKVTAPNGGAIHIVAQHQITNEQLIRCRNILEHYLKDYPDSVYGKDKSDIANKMVENNAVLTLLNGQDDGNLINLIRVGISGIFGQALFYNEIQVEGHDWYVDQNYNHRDASYEEILHFVHDNGIGVDGRNSLPGAMPDFQKEIRAAQINGQENGIWASGEREQDWIQELEEENSLSQEYLASVIDSYYGLWGAWNTAEGGMWGIYKAKTREELVTHDSEGYKLMQNKFFHPYLTYNARIHDGFNGTYSLKFDAAVPYTNHSRYLKDITLLGANDIDVIVNELDNDVTGNAGVNTIIFSGKSTEYTIQKGDDHIAINDSILSRDGNNILRKIDTIRFSDTSIQY